MKCRVYSLFLCLALLVGLLPVTASAAADINYLNIKIADPVASYSPGGILGMESNISDPMGRIQTISVSWRDTFFDEAVTSTDEFIAGLPYKVTIKLYAPAYQYFARDIYGDLDATITLNGRPVTVEEVYRRNDGGIQKIEGMKISYQYDALSGAVLTRALVKNVPAPVAGQHPSFSFTLGNPDAYGYYPTEPITWYDQTAGKYLSSNDTFIAGHRYRLNIWLTANRSNGFTFKVNSSGDPEVDVTLNSFAPDAVNTAYEQDPREVIDISYLFPVCQESHTCSPVYVPQEDPSCLMPGFKAYYACSCGKNFEDAAGKKEITDMDGYGILPAEGHKEGGWSYNGTHHYKKCTTCNEVIPGTNAAHSGGTATCQEKAVCTVCGMSYGQTNENHNPDTKWTACGDLYHAHLCKACGAHCDPEDHKPGPAATEKEPQICTVCGYILVPAKGHTHKLTKVAKVAASCTEPGNIEYYTCSGCSLLFADKDGKQEIPASTSVTLAPLGHTVSDDWKQDEDYHWRICKVCGTVLGETKMVHEMKNGSCTSCGQTAATEPNVTVPPTQPNTVPTTPQTGTQPTTNPSVTHPTTQSATQPSATQGSSQTDPDKEAPDMTWIWIAVAAVLGVAIGVVIPMVTKKKKS